MYLGKKIVVVMPAYNASKTLAVTVEEAFDSGIVDSVILVDDASRDGTAELARRIPGVQVHVHAKNMGYGANQKTCYRLALKAGADIVIMVHPDYQYTPKLIPAMASMVASGLYSCVLASRILGKGALRGGMPFWKYAANRVLTSIENALLGERVSEYHTGYRAFSRELLEQIDLTKNSDDFAFDNEMLCQIFWRGFSVGELSCPAKYFPEASSINFRRSLVYGIACLGVGMRYRLAKWDLLRSHLFPVKPRSAPSFMDKIRSRWSADKSILIYIIALVVISRVFFGILGVSVLKEHPLQERLDFRDAKMELIAQQPAASVWFVYDSYWYLKIAKDGYADSVPLNLEHQSSIGFFPLYPALMRAARYVIGDYLWSGILVSNAFLIVGVYLLYRLIRLDADETVARRGVLFFLLLPAGFILSGIYPMSTLFCMWVASALAARLNRFSVAGLCGMAAALSHPLGGFIIIPIFLIYLQNKRYALKKVRFDILYLGLIPFSIVLFCISDYFISGDPLAYFHMQTMLWGHQQITNPLSLIVQSLHFDSSFVINAYFIIIACAILLFNYRRLYFPYWFFSIFMLLFIPMTNTVLGSIRYSCALFPIAVLFAVFPKNKAIAIGLAAFLAALQTALFVFWTLGFVFMS